MGCVLAPVQNRGSAQLLDAPEEIHILVHHLQGWATDMLHGVPKGVTYEETFETLEDHFRDQHLAAAYHSQLKTRTQGFGESSEKFATVVEQLAHYPRTI
jgi:hypothetical protein